MIILVQSKGQYVGKSRNARSERERARLYQARQEFHAGLVSRRRRDTLLAIVIGGAIIIATVVTQTMYFTAGPGTPTPTPEPASSTAPPSLTDIFPIPGTPAIPDPSATSP